MQQSPLNKLSRRERQIMDVLFEHREQSAQDIQKALPDPPGYSAVRALLARLVEKKLVRFRQDGARYVYSPVIAETTVQASAVARLLKTFFKGSRASAVNALLDAEGAELSKRELEEIESTIQRLKQVSQDRGEQS